MNESPLSMNKHKLHKQAHNRSCFLNGRLNSASPAYLLHCIRGWHYIRVYIPGSTDQSHHCIWVLFRLFLCCLDKFSTIDWAAPWKYTPLKGLSWNLNNFRIHSRITKWTCSPKQPHTIILLYNISQAQEAQLSSNRAKPPHSRAYRKEKKEGGERERGKKTGKWGLLSPLHNSQLRPYRWQNSPNQCFTGSTRKKPAQWEAAIKNKTGITERIRLHRKWTEKSIGHCHTTTLISILPQVEHFSLITSILKLTAIGGSENKNKLRCTGFQKTGKQADKRMTTTPQKQLLALFTGLWRHPLKSGKENPGKT